MSIRWLKTRNFSPGGGGVLVPLSCCRGAASLNSVLFVITLVAVGLMYFYFQRCRSLERELAKWRTGTYTKTQKPKAPQKASLADIANVMREKIIGLPSEKKNVAAQTTPEGDNRANAEVENAPEQRPLTRATKTPAPTAAPTEKPPHKSLIPVADVSTESEEPREEPAKQAEVAEAQEEEEEQQPEPTPTPRSKRSASGERGSTLEKPQSANPRKQVIESAYDAPDSAEAETAHPIVDERRTTRQRARVTSQND